jgi:hypothetical protein
VDLLHDEVLGVREAAAQGLQQLASLAARNTLSTEAKKGKTKEE